MGPVTGVVLWVIGTQVPGVSVSREARANEYCLGTSASVWLLANIKLDLPGSWIRVWEARQRPEGLPALHQQLEGAAGFGNLCVQLPSAGQMEDPGPVLWQSVYSHLVEGSIWCVCMYICFPLTDCRPQPAREGYRMRPWCCLCLQVLCFLSVLNPVAGHRYICKYTYGAYVILSGIHTQPHRQLSRGLWSCSSLLSAGLSLTDGPFSARRFQTCLLNN